jgi:arylsulfatase A-like enzyme/Tfp pilus assembly protein PilF
VAPCGCDRRERPNVLVVTVDTLRADRLGCYGFGLAHTPAIDQLAAEGVRCSDVATSAPITLPAHCSIMTGLYPPAHGVRDNGNYSLAPEAVTLAERLRAAGYRTGAFVSAAVLARRYGLDQGFDTYDDDLWSEDDPELFMIRERPAPHTIDRALAWLADGTKTAQRQPFFLWVHLFDPHQPYSAHSIDLTALAPTPYDAEIAEVDRAVGRLVDWLRDRAMLDDTLVVLTADHGESLGEHGEPTHGIFIYDSTIRVPLVWRLPRVLPAGVTYPGSVRHIDIVPTVLAILGLPGGEATQGADLLAGLHGRGPALDLPQYSEARLAEEGFGMAPLFGMRHDGRKFIQAPHPELYDLRTDRQEQHNVYPDDPRAARPLEERLESVVADSGQRALTVRTREIDRETEEMLRALGYLAPPEQRAEMAGIDPKDGMVLYAKLQEARQLAQIEEWDAAKRLLDEVLAVAPENVTARNVLALIAVRKDDLDEAERQYLASLAMQPQQHRIVSALGSIALRRGNFDEAERRFREVLDRAPTYVEAMSNLGWVEAMRGNPAGAEAWYQRALAVDPTYPHVYRRLADLYYDRRDWNRALDYYRRVLATLPEYFAVLIQAGNSARFMDDEETAAAYYAEAGRVRSDSWVPSYNLACLRAVNGQPEPALTLLADAADRGFASTTLLQKNDDFDGLRGRPGWSALVARVEAAAAKERADRPGHSPTVVR